MIYKLLENENTKEFWIDSKKQFWPYISAKHMQKLYPNGGYMTVGDVKKKIKKDSPSVLVGNGQKIPVLPFQPKLKSGEKCVGYIGVESEESAHTYIRIIEKKKGWLFLLPLLLLLLGLLILLGLKLMDDKGPNLDNSAISYHIEGLENKDDSNISIPIFGKITVDSETMESEIHLANPKGNPCYFQYKIIMKDSKEELFKSGLIEPGTAIPKVSINQQLTPGEYPAMIIVNTFALEDHTVAMNGGEMDVTLVVKEEN